MVSPVELLVPFRGENYLGPCPLIEILVPFRGLFKIFDEHPRHFYRGVPRAEVIVSVSISRSIDFCNCFTKLAPTVLVNHNKNANPNHNSDHRLYVFAFWLLIVSLVYLRFDFEYLITILYQVLSSKAFDMVK